MILTKHKQVFLNRRTGLMIGFTVRHYKTYGGILAYYDINQNLIKKYKDTNKQDNKYYL